MRHAGERERRTSYSDVYCDLIERELREALEDIAAMREDQSEAKRRCMLLKAALGNARYYLRELELSL
jgi:hypothetical protein